MSKEMNPWTTEDEKEHFPSVLEWWCTEGFIHTTDQKKSWSFKASFTEWCTQGNKLGSTYDFTLFDLKKKTHTSYYIRNDEKKLDITYDANNHIITKYDDSYLNGSYPYYTMKYMNPNDAITLALHYQSESVPHWITQDITGGYLPMGTGFYRYGFIPRNTIQGTLYIQDKQVTVEGTGYYEHVWGDFSYKHPLSNLSYLKKSISIYQKLIGWWMHHHSPKIPNTIKFSSENNPFGYDWIWAVLDNGWSMFLGNILFWISEGPIFGTLILTKDGNTYQEFCDVTYRYKRMEKSDYYDFYYPTAFEITAKNDDETLHITCEMIMSSREFVTPLDQKKWIAFVICEAPGKLTGSYTNKHQTIKLSGKCKIEPQRQVSYYGHNEITIQFVKPPKGVGVKIHVDSNYLQKNITSHLYFTPLPTFKFSMKYKTS